MNYKEEIAKAKDFLNEKDYIFCTMQCGKILETAIKYLYYCYLKRANKDERIRILKIQQELSKLSREKSYKDFTLGKMITFLEKSNIISKIIPYNNKQNRMAQINLWDLVDIRNRSAHSNRTDKDGIREEDAYIMYGNVLRIINSPEIIQYMKSYKEDKTCSSCHEIYNAKDGFICKSCGRSFCKNCESEENELCVKCKDKEAFKRKTPRIEIKEALIKFTSIPFESHLYERLRNIYSVLYFMNQGYDFVHAVKLTQQQFSNITYETIADACGRRFAGNIPNFKEWYQTGIILEKLRSKFYLSNNDYKIFEDLLSKRRKPLSPIESDIKIVEIPKQKRKIYVTKIYPRRSPPYVTAGQFRHLGNGIFQYSEDLNIKINANLSSGEVKRELGSFGLFVKNIGSFYYQLRVKADLVNR